MSKKIILQSIFVLFLGLILAGCNTVQPGEYDTAEVGKVKKVIPGTIISKRPVNLRRNMINKSQDASIADNNYSPSHGIEYVIKLNSGEIISVVQTEDLKLKPKQRILVIHGRHTRVVADNGSEGF